MLDAEADGRRDGSVGSDRNTGEPAVLEVVDGADGPAQDRGGGVCLGHPPGIRDDRDSGEVGVGVGAGRRIDDVVVLSSVVDPTTGPGARCGDATVADRERGDRGAGPVGVVDGDQPAEIGRRDAGGGDVAADAHERTVDALVEEFDDDDVGGEALADTSGIERQPRRECGRQRADRSISMSWTVEPVARTLDGDREPVGIVDAGGVAERQQLMEARRVVAPAGRGARETHRVDQPNRVGSTGIQVSGWLLMRVMSLVSMNRLHARSRARSRRSASRAASGGPPIVVTCVALAITRKQWRIGVHGQLLPLVVAAGAGAVPVRGRCDSLVVSATRTRHGWARPVMGPSP